ncbi:hypothetical protein J4419_00975 [Candidatus Woesearchaeota archaeon]|nr:hypothetical protein [Candidatus Woesearchaeota archaeon]
MSAPSQEHHGLVGRVLFLRGLDLAGSRADRRGQVDLYGSLDIAEIPNCPVQANRLQVIVYNPDKQIHRNDSAHVYVISGDTKHHNKVYAVAIDRVLLLGPPRPLARNPLRGELSRMSFVYAEPDVRTRSLEYALPFLIEHGSPVHPAHAGHLEQQRAYLMKGSGDIELWIPRAADERLPLQDALRQFATRRPLEVCYRRQHWGGPEPEPVDLAPEWKSLSASRT